MRDLFISHASEDKEAFVKLLAVALKDVGIDIWYDEFELKIGDSLSRSIDKGLIDSKYGIVILSKSFFEKKWTEYELKSLLAKDIQGKNVILPIWHNISINDVQMYSLYLSDIFSFSSNVPLTELTEEILKVVRPDILNNHLLCSRGHKIRKELLNSDRISIPICDIEASPIRHSKLPAHMVISCLLISEVLNDVSDLDYIDMCENFARDLEYDTEFMVWSAIASSYISFIKEKQWDYNDINKKKEVYNFLVMNSLNIEHIEYRFLSDSDKEILKIKYMNDLIFINKMVGNIFDI